MPTVPRFDASDRVANIPAARLMKQAGFGKGYNQENRVRIRSKHTLALVGVTL
jgi:hypothetical protein